MSTTIYHFWAAHEGVEVNQSPGCSTDTNVTAPSDLTLEYKREIGEELFDQELSFLMTTRLSGKPVQVC